MTQNREQLLFWSDTNGLFIHRWKKTLNPGCLSVRVADNKSVWVKIQRCLSLSGLSGLCSAQVHAWSHLLSQVRQAGPDHKEHLQDATQR